MGAPIDETGSEGTGAGEVDDPTGELVAILVGVAGDVIRGGGGAEEKGFTWRNFSSFLIFLSFLYS